jgi:hypothetical protein
MDQHQAASSQYVTAEEAAIAPPKAPKKRQSAISTLASPVLRIRSDSTGSTRGAFVVNKNDIPPILQGNRNSVKHKPSTSGAANFDQNPSQSASDQFMSLAKLPSNIITSGEETNFVSESRPVSYQQNIDGLTFDSKFQQRDHQMKSSSSNGGKYHPPPNTHGYMPFINKKDQGMRKNSFFSSIIDSFHSNLHDFYYSPPEDVGPLIQSLRSLFYDPINPEFTSLQQSSWAVILGVFFGVTTALWQRLIEASCDFIWNDIPAKLLQWGFFTDLNGSFPLPHFCWICTSVFGGFLSWVSVSLPVVIPGQNEWIEGVHRQGILDPSAFWYIFLISTGGMMSGLSLGPELPLVLLSGMVGSFLAVRMHQSVLSARVMVLTAGGAAVGGFFGFPMAGALFVLELPHRE